MSATDEKPIPIHLGELLKNEPIPQGGTKKNNSNIPRSSRNFISKSFIE